MLFPRIIPCLLIKDNGLVKTVNFKDPIYVGDPINAVKIFNEKCADELIVIDIDATKKNIEPNYNLISHLAMESRMPLCYGGGIKSTDQALRILSMGVEKVAVSSLALENPEVISEISSKVGSQSVVGVLDIKKKLFSNNYDIMTHNGYKKTRFRLEQTVKKLESIGCGELLINSIDNDGTMKGYDKKLISKIIQNISIPLTAVGGAGSLSDIEDMIKSFGVIGIAVGSLFVFKGKYKAVLVNYPDMKIKNELIRKNLR